MVLGVSLVQMGAVKDSDSTMQQSGPETDMADNQGGEGDQKQGNDRQSGKRLTLSATNYSLSGRTFTPPPTFVTCSAWKSALHADCLG